MDEVDVTVLDEHTYRGVIQFVARLDLELTALTSLRQALARDCLNASVDCKGCC
jgi:hypothetical protein